VLAAPGPLLLVPDDPHWADRETLQFLRSYGPQAPDELGMVLFAPLAPPGPMMSPEHYGKPVLGLTLTWAGDPAEGRRAVAPLRRAATPIADDLRPRPTCTSSRRSYVAGS
jgi:hypothetical protein